MNYAIGNMLTVDGTKVYADGVEVPKYDATEFALTNGTSPVIFSQLDANRSLFIDTGDSTGGLHWYDYRLGGIVTATLPAFNTDGAMTATINVLDTSSVDTLATESEILDIEAVLGFHKVGSPEATGFTAADSVWIRPKHPYGLDEPYALLYNTDGDCAIKDGWYKDTRPVWAAGKRVRLGDYCQPLTPTTPQHYYKATAISGSLLGTTDDPTEPTWPTDGTSVVDNDITWTDQGALAYPDWSAVVRMKFDAKANKVGSYMAFAFGTAAIDTGETDWSGTTIPFVLTAGENSVTLPMSGVSEGSRDSVMWYGMYCTAEEAFVIHFQELTYNEGTTGKRDYVRTRSLIIGDGEDWETEFLSPESAVLEDVDAGSVGAEIVLDFGTDDVPTGYVDKIWRRDKEVTTRYHYVGDAVAGSTSYTDSIYDISANPYLVTGRTAVPTGGTCIGTYNDRTVLYKRPWIYISDKQDPTTFINVTPQEVSDLLDIDMVTDLNGLKLPVGDIGNIVAMARFGLTTTQQYGSGLLMMTDAGWDCILQGDSPRIGQAENPFNMAHRHPGGICGPYAWCHDGDGRIVKIDPNGDIYAVDSRLQYELLSGPIQKVLQSASSRSSWVLTYDGLNGLITAFCGEAGNYVFDGKSRAITEHGTLFEPTCWAYKPTADGGNAMIGGATGQVYRLYDPDADTETVTYISPLYTRTNAKGLMSENAVQSILAEFTGDWTWTVYAGGSLVWSGQLTSGIPLWLPYASGDSLQWKCVGTGSITMVRLQAVPVGGV